MMGIKRASVVIIGGGIIGCSIAYNLARMGCKNLGQELDYDIELNQGGYLMLAYTEKEVNQFKKNVALEQSLGIDARFITVEEAKEIVPPLNAEGVLGATFCPSDGHANPFITNFAYAEAAQRLGVRI